tara:strand:+ start:1389 stop:1748 length:360 start_codon:yes stop_codon:yes gene_type:complete
MKKLLLSIVMLFSITMQSQELSEQLKGVWSSNKTSYYVVILHDSIKGYEFINFSFKENKSLPEVVVNTGENYVTTKLTNPSNNYKVNITYKVVDDELHCTFEGGSNHQTVYRRYWVMTN